MKTFRFWILALLCAVAQGAWAQTTVSTDQELRAAIQNNGANITVTADIDLSNSTLSIPSGTTVTIDLGGHTLDRKLTKRGEGGGQVITVRSGATLNLSNGTLKGGWGGAGGALSNEGGTVTLTDVIITNNVADDRGGGICNREGGTLTMTGGVITDNSSNDHSGAKGGGGLFNEENATATLLGVTITGNTAELWGGGGICNYGTLKLDSCIITGNEAKLWEGGGICNYGTLTMTGDSITGNTCAYSGGGIYTAASATLTLDGCTITGNTCGKNGGGIWTAASATLNMKGKMTVADNTTVDGATNNLFLKTDAVITVTGNLFGSSIGISMEAPGVFTSGYVAKNYSIDPTTIFFSDLPMIMDISSTKTEAKLAYKGSFSFIECSWDDVNKEVVYTTKTLNYYLDDINIAPYTDTDYKVVTSGPGVYSLGGRSTRHPDYPEYFIARGNIDRASIRVDGPKVHLILCDGATLNVNNLMVNPGYKLYIHSQSYGASMGKLIADNNGYNEYVAGIGSGNGGTHESYKEGPELIEIHGGNIYAKGGDNAAGIGGGEWCKGGTIVIYGGNIKAYGGDGGGTDGSAGAGIGGGNLNSGGNVTVYGGSVYAKGGPDAAGIGSGNCGYLAEHYPGHGGWFTMYGGYVEAHGADNGAGIGAGEYSAGPKAVNLYGGTVKAYGGDDAAGIGGGYFTTGNFDSGAVNIYGGEVYAYGKGEGAGIGGGENGKGAKVTITGGIVVAHAGENETGYKAIGPGRDNDDYGSLTIGDSMMVSSERIFTAAERVPGCWYRTKARIEPCDHQDHTYKVDGTTADDTHTEQCKYCTTPFEPEQHTFVDKICTVCGVHQTFGGGTGIVPIDNGQLIIDNEAGGVYDLSGRKINSQFKKKGIYIVNGKKVVIK